MKRRLIFFIAMLAAIAFLGEHLLEAGQEVKSSTKSRSGGVTLEVLNPRGEIPPITTKGIVPRLRDLDSKKIGLVDNGKAGADYFLDATEELLKSKFPGMTVLRFRKTEGTINPAPKMYSAVAEKCDAFIYATGD